MERNAPVVFQNQGELTLPSIPGGIVLESNFKMASVQTGQVVEELDARLDGGVIFSGRGLEYFDIELGKHVLYCPQRVLHSV